MPLLLILALVLQQPRDTRPDVPGTAVLSGIVVTDDAQAHPIRRARVSLSGDGAGSGRTTITDDDGRFEFPGLPPGRYTVGASRYGWIAMQYGAKRSQRAGTAVPLASGERAAITIRLPRGSVITGIVTDEQGQPAPDLAVRAMRYAVQSGERRLVSAGIPSLTDERGVYRIYNLPAGEYFVGTSIGASRAFGQNLEIRLTTDLDVRYALAGAREDPPPPDRTADYAPVYYSAAASPADAIPVTVRAGEERDGIDLAIRLIPTVRVEGTVAMPDGTPPTGPAVVTLVASGQPRTMAAIARENLKMTRPWDDGTFEFTNVAPGQYTIVARIASTLTAAADIVVGGEPVTGVSLVLGPGATLAGVVRFEGRRLAPPSPSSVRITLDPVQTQGSAVVTPRGTPQPDGRFTLQGATPGRYRLDATLGTEPRSGWLVRSAMINGQDALDVPIVIQPNQSVGDVVITFTDTMAELAGTLENASGRPAPDYTIVLFPEDQALWVPQSRRIQATRPAADGSYTFRNLPAGTYLLAAVDDAEQGAWYDPAWLQALVAASMKITIGEGQKLTQQIRLSREW